MQIVQNWRLNGQRYALKGVQCVKCGKVSFPPREVCQDCREAELKAQVVPHQTNRTTTAPSWEVDTLRAAR